MWFGLRSQILCSAIEHFLVVLARVLECHNDACCPHGFLSHMRIVLLVSAACSCLTMAEAFGPAAQGPCDVYAAAGTPCVAAHSMVRAMYTNYTGPLYNLQRASDNATTDIGVLSTGFANGAAQVAFCTTPVPTVCTIERIFDQSGRGNHLERVMVTPGNIHDWPTNGINAMRDQRHPSSARTSRAARRTDRAQWDSALTGAPSATRAVQPSATSRSPSIW